MSIAPLARQGQSWLDHARSVSKRAHRLGSRFEGRLPGFAEMSALAGYWHDYGKLHLEWQAGLQENIRRGVRGALRHHSAAGAALLAVAACEQGQPVTATALAYAVAAHHSGLGEGERHKASCVAKRVGSALPDLPVIKDAAGDLASPIGPIPALPGTSLSFTMRLLASVLIDADRGDASAETIRCPTDLNPLCEAVAAHAASLGNAPGERNALRRRAYAACMNHAGDEPGVFTLTGPTGIGKTLAGLSFALHHAETHGLEGVIYVAPFLSIIDQTARTMRGILGDSAVVEHHSAVDRSRADLPEFAEDARREIEAIETYDAPVIATTAVQFFENLHDHRASRLRRIHNIARRVILLDEAQCTPVGLADPIFHVLRGLVEAGATVVLMTATQPHITPSRLFAGLPGARELLDDPESYHAAAAEKVDLHLPPTRRRPKGWSTIAAKLAAEPQALCIVNTRRGARALFEEVCDRRSDGSCFHLSTWMCQQDRLDTLDVIRARLRAGEPVIVVATSLIEAGVDVDFPVVFRAMAGLDALAQAAGRCNREWSLAKGRFEVIETPEGNRSVDARAAIAWDVLADSEKAGDHRFCLDNFRAYFRRLYAGCRDEKAILAQTERDQPNFRTASERFRMIEQKDEVPVLVVYDAASRAIAQELMRYDALDREAKRALFARSSRYFVNVRPAEADRLAVTKFSSVLGLQAIGLRVTEEYRRGLGIQKTPSKAVERTTLPLAA